MVSVRKPFEMPALCTTLDDLGLSQPDSNQSRAKRLLTAPYKVLHEDGYVLLGITMHDSLGEIFLIKKDEETLTYHLKFKFEHVDLIGQAATQVSVWRRCAPGLEGGTSGIIYSLLDRYDAIVSDPSITTAGQRYWIDRIAEAHQKGWTVGVMDGDILVPYDGGRSLLDWVRTLDSRDDNDAPKRTCFFISKTAVTRGDLRTPR